MIVMIDNYDSFTYNLVQYFSELGQEVVVHRNDQITINQIKKLNPDYIVLSPGPCTPKEAGISLEVVDFFKGKIPILGVCLGHQTIGQAFGGKIIHAKTIMHGKTSEIFHNNEGVFKGIESPFIATRYHSLVIERASCPECFNITSWTDDDEIMGIKHKTMPIEGVQFHPESILSQHGHVLLRNFLENNG
ncbi:aminodeoxychorismate/anthranilate synthase component II [Methylophilaceae bacterium]|jgi:anthranilate synthase component II|nr:aminodeoxychorismate/anthranilate synthase component II [Methylophilaceae bacterium]